MVTSMLTDFPRRPAILALALLAGCGERHAPADQDAPQAISAVTPGAVSITISPGPLLMDQRLDVAVSGLRPAETAMLLVRAQASDGLWWRSRAVFRADLTGRLDLAAQSPISAGYHGVDAMGVFWSMSPDGEPSKAEHAAFDIRDPAKPNETELEVIERGQIVSSRRIQRSFLGPDVHSTPAADGLDGVLYAPGDGKAHPAVLVIGGSDGGPGAPGVAMLLASHGFTALSIAYFGDPGLPATLQHVPMETFTHALAWLRRQPSVDPGFVAIYGESRGAEPALWTAARDEGVAAVVARSPSFVLWGGVSANHMPGGAAWTWHGRDLPFIANRIFPDFAARYLADLVTRTPVRQTPLFLEDLKGFGDTSRVEIPVEKIHGPVMLLAGRDDQIWPSAFMAGRIMARLRGRHPYPDVMVAYDDVGHPIPYAYTPLGGDRRRAALDVGGTEAGTAKAQADAWPKILAFLEAAAHRSVRGEEPPSRTLKIG